MSVTNQRFPALDVFRGMTICLMIIVNTPGNGDTTFAPLLHASWNGFTPTDLVFPSFMFAVGNAMSFVMRKWEFMSTSRVVGKILKRTILIFLLGYLMYWFPFFQYNQQHELVLKPIAETRIFGVLQRIALAYGISSLMLYFFKTRATVIITIIILLLYKPILMFFGDSPDPLSLAGNAVLKLDRWLIGDKHLYMGEGVPFDPEGLLSTFPSIGNIVGGFVAGAYIQERGKTFEGLAKLLLVGFLIFVIAYWWNFGFPINKKLWTSTFVLHTVGLDCMLLAVVIYYVDFLGRTKGTYFFQVFGKNPLFIYLLSEVGVIIMWLVSVGGTSLYQWLYQNVFSHAGAYTGSLLFAISWMLFCWMVGYIMDRKKWYVRV
ncbi:acyltransferase family protein [Foetidibacter luteolus]|uniref:acyltransferase family protein n=1 Tax=Foetidibacter luteolus TaxID=2608880 RepID=UPI00129B48AC|nr:heparan-alpha-glucosaminide N-acetyltransferase domain-containing protein [Foetidibacter luteolus]